MKHTLLASLSLAAAAAVCPAQTTMTVQTFPDDSNVAEINRTHAEITLDVPDGDLALLLVNVTVDPEGTADAAAAASTAYPFLSPANHDQPGWKLNELRALLGPAGVDATEADQNIWLPVGRIHDYVNSAHLAGAGTQSDFGIQGPSNAPFVQTSTASGSSAWDERFPWHAAGVWDDSQHPTRFNINALARETVKMYVHDIYNTYYQPHLPHESQVDALYEFLLSETGFVVTFQSVVLQGNAPPGRPRVFVTPKKTIKRISLGPNTGPRIQFLGGYFTVPNITIDSDNAWITYRTAGEILRVEFKEPIQSHWTVQAYVPLDNGNYGLFSPLPQTVYPAGHPEEFNVVAPHVLDWVVGPNWISGGYQFVVSSSGVPTELLPPLRPWDGDNPNTYYGLTMLAGIQ